MINYKNSGQAGNKIPGTSIAHAYGLYLSVPASLVVVLPVFTVILLYLTCQLDYQVGQNCYFRHDNPLPPKSTRPFSAS